MEFVDHLWQPFLDQPQSEMLVFEIINFHIYRSGPVSMSPMI